MIRYGSIDPAPLVEEPVHTKAYTLEDFDQPSVLECLLQSTLNRIPPQEDMDLILNTPREQREDHGGLSDDFMETFVHVLHPFIDGNFPHATPLGGDSDGPEAE